jgi:hypothetical protein
MVVAGLVLFVAAPPNNQEPAHVSVWLSQRGNSSAASAGSP